MASTPNPADIAQSVAKLTISPAKTKPKPKAKKIVDSWEDEDLSSSDDEIQKDSQDNSPADRTADVSATASPPLSSPRRPPPARAGAAIYGPPTPSSPAASWSAADASGSTPARRPEKTDAVARRMIASALGVRVPRLTEEQKAYDRSLREAEQKRREEARAAQKKEEEDKERAKRAVWDD